MERKGMEKIGTVGTEDGGIFGIMRNGNLNFREFQ
jgi:hypothetical protein